MGEVGKLVRITTMHHRMATTRQILDMVGPYRVSDEPTVLYFVWFHVDGVKMWDTHVNSPLRVWGCRVVGCGSPQPAPTTCDHLSES